MKTATDNGQKLNHWVFNQDGSVTNDALVACKFFNIDPQTLIYKPMESFGEPDVDEAIIKIRFQHYDEKRKGKIKIIADSIKTGMLEEMKQTFVQPEELKAKAEIKTRRNQLSSVPDIPLASPLDPEHARNHREAVIYEQNKCMERAKQNLQKLKANYEEKMKLQNIKNQKKELDIQKNLQEKLKEKKEEIKEKNDFVLGPEGKLAAQKKKIRASEYQNFQQIKEMQKQEEQQRQEREKKASEAKELKFQIDLQRRQSLQQRAGSAQQKKVQEDEAIQHNLEVFVNKMDKGTKLKERELQKRQEEMHQKLEQEMEKHYKLKEQSPEKELQRFHQAIQNLTEKEKRVLNKQKEQRDDLKNKFSDLNDKLHQVREQKRHSDHQFREKTKQVMEVEKEKLKQIQTVKQQYKQEMERRKEIMLLRKLDQEENFQRGKNFHNLYKNKLIEQIIEKSAKADAIKMAQERITKACQTNKNMHMTSDNRKMVKEEDKKNMAKTQ